MAKTTIFMSLLLILPPQCTASDADDVELMQKRVEVDSLMEDGISNKESKLNTSGTTDQQKVLEHDRAGTWLQNSSWHQRGKLRRHMELTPSACDADGSKEYCPASDSCVPDQDCSSCTGYIEVNNNLHLCEAPVPPFVTEHCGLAPSVKCKTFAMAMDNCISSCSSTIQYDTSTSAMGSCIAGAICPAPACWEICNCRNHDASTCDHPCFSTCSKYQNCVLFGNGVKATTAGELVAFYYECVFGGHPAAGHKAAYCGCHAR